MWHNFLFRYYLLPALKKSFTCFIVPSFCVIIAADREVGRMWKFLCPKRHVESVQEINLHDLKEKGIKGIITDLDNTLVCWNDEAVLPAVTKWLKEAKEKGFQVCIVSNNNKERCEQLSWNLELPAIWQAVKPRRRSFLRALKMMDLQPYQAAVVGDQVFTDILGGNRLGLYTILVKPLSRREFVGTRCVRQFEKVVLFGLKKRGHLK